ncbi:MAG: hypothetical protein U0744_21855 [Gemmataceae bacterium]
MTAKLAGIEGEHAVIQVAASSPLVRLIEASFAIDGSRWSSTFPTDGLLRQQTRNASHSH